MFGEISNRVQYNIVKSIMNSRMKDGSKPHCTYDFIATFEGMIKSNVRIGKRRCC